MSTYTVSEHVMRAAVNVCPRNPAGIRVGNRLFDALHNARRYPVRIDLNEYELAEVRSWPGQASFPEGAL